jgi:hypothetical protein
LSCRLLSKQTNFLVYCEQIGDNLCANGLHGAAVVSVLVFLQYAIARLAPWCGREETPFAFLVPPSRCELPLPAFWEKNRRWAVRDFAPRSQRRSRWSRVSGHAGWSRSTSRSARRGPRDVAGPLRLVAATRGRCSRAYISSDNAPWPPRLAPAGLLNDCAPRTQRRCHSDMGNANVIPRCAKSQTQHDPKNEAEITYWNNTGGRHWVERQQSQDIVPGRANALGERDRARTGTAADIDNTLAQRARALALKRQRPAPPAAPGLVPALLAGSDPGRSPFRGPSASSRWAPR